MIRVIVPPGAIWTPEPGLSYSGPWEAVRDSVFIPVSPGPTIEAKNRGEWTLQPDGTFSKTLPYTREEMGALPICWAMVVCLLLSWARRFVLLALFCASALQAQSISNYRVQFYVATGKPYAQIRVKSGNGTIKSIVGLPSAGQLYTYTNALDFIIVEGTGIGSGSSIDFTPSGRFWKATPVYAGQPTPGVSTPDGTSLGGTPDKPNLVDNGGGAVNPDTGAPVSTPGSNPGTPGSPENPFFDLGGGIGGTGGGGGSGGGSGGSSNPPQTWTGTVTITNNLPMAVAYEITALQIGGTRSERFTTPILQPGQQHTVRLTLDFAFSWSYAPIIDGNTIGIDPTPVVPPTQDPNANPPGGGVTAPITPTLPSLAGASDNVGATNRVAEYVRQYGEAARQTGNAINGNLDEIGAQLERAINKLGSIDSKTGTNTGGGGSGGTGSGVTSIEGDQWSDVVGIKDNTAGTNAPAEAPDATEGLLPSPTSQTGMRDGMERLGNATAGLIASLGLNGTTTARPLQWTIPFGMFGSFVLDLEAYGSVLDFIRNLMLGLVSISFVNRLLHTIRHSLVG